MTRWTRSFTGVLTLTVLVTGATVRAGDDETAPPAPPTLGATPGAHEAERIAVLFDGTSWSGWRQRDGKPSPWKVTGDGAVVVHGGDAITRDEFGDFQLHLEFMCPLMEGREGQARANSGVYLHGRYEIQVLDSYGLPPQANTCGAIYSIAPALTNAALPPDRYQTYDIVFRAPRFGDDGTVTEHARVTVVHNGIVIHNNVELPHATPGGIASDVVATGPIMLQDHGNPIRYRNVWVRRLD